MNSSGRMWGRAAAFILVLGLSCACSQSRPIYTVEKEPIPQVSPPLTLQQIETRILSGASSGRWRLRAIAPGKIEGLLTVKLYHTALVTIDYDRRFYSIRYKSSVMLKAGQAAQNDPRAGKFLIHHSYNTHVRALQQSINDRLSSAPG